MEALIIGALGISFMIFLAKLNTRNTIKRKPKRSKSDSQNKFSIAWVIEKDEKRKRTREGIKRRIPYVFPILALGAAIEYSKINSYIEPLIFVGIILLGFLVVYVATYIWPYKKRQYTLDELNILVTRGERSKKYAWEDFEYFFGDPDRKSYRNRNYKNKENRENYVKDMRGIEGESFYLKIKPSNILSRLVKNVLVIYTEPDNCNEVHDFLSQKLTERNGLNLSLVHYQFK